MHNRLVRGRSDLEAERTLRWNYYVVETGITEAQDFRRWHEQPNFHLCWDQGSVAGTGSSLLRNLVWGLGQNLSFCEGKLPSLSTCLSGESPPVGKNKDCIAEGLPLTGPTEHCLGN